MSRVLAASKQKAKPAHQPATIEGLFKELQAIKYKVDADSDESAEFVQKCLSICSSFDLSAEDFALKFEAFKYSQKIKAKMSLHELDRLSAQIAEQQDAERRRANKQSAGGIRVKLEQPKGAAVASLMRSSQASSQRSSAFDAHSLALAQAASTGDELDDLFGDIAPSMPTIVKQEPASPAKRKAQVIDDDNGAEEEHKSQGGSAPRKRAHVDGAMDAVAEEEDGMSGDAAPSATSASSSSNSSAPSRALHPSFHILAVSDPSNKDALYPSALGKYATRANKGETAVILNEQTLVRIEASSGELSAEERAEREKRIIEIEVYQPAEDLLAEQNDEDAAAAAAAAATAATVAAAAAATSKTALAAAKYAKRDTSSTRSKSGGIDTSIFRYMYQNEDELREALETNMFECSQLIMDKPEFQSMRLLVKSEAVAASLARSLVTKAAAAGAPVKKEPAAAGEEKKKEDGSVSTPPASDATMEDAATPAASADPASSSSSSSAAAASTPAASSSSSAAATPASASSSSSAAAAAAAPIPIDDDDESDSSNLVPIVSVAASKGQHSVILCGRVVYDPNDALSEGVGNEVVQKLTATHSVWIEGDKALSGGARIQMRLNGLRSYGLFPGQVVLAKGINASGMSFVAEEILTDASLPHASMPRTKVAALNASLGDRPLGLMVAAGPFTTSDDLTFAPLFELLREAVRVKPDVLLLLGPFLDGEHKDLSGNYSSLTSTYDQLFFGLLGDIMAHLRGLKIKVLIVPSVRDLAAIPIFPQPAFDLSAAPSDLLRDVASGRLCLLPNPATFRLNDLTVSVSSMDIISHLGNSNEISKAPPVQLGQEIQGRLQRLAGHCLSSHSFYPLFPAPDGVHLDYSHVANLKMHNTPDLLILPSKTRYFASAVSVGSHPAAPASAAAGESPSAPQSSPTIVVNPEYLTKGPSGGTYGLVSIHPLRDEEMVPPPNSHDRLSDHCMMSRTRVDIIRI